VLFIFRTIEMSISRDNYKWLIQDNGLETLYDEFIYSAEMHSGTLSNDKLEYSFIEYYQEDFGEPTFITERFSDYLRVRLNLINNILKSKIDDLVDSRAIESKSKLLLILDSLNFYISKLDNIKLYNQKLSLLEYMIDIPRYLKNKYPSLLLEHDIYSHYINSSPPILDGLFGFKLIISKIESLYNILRKLDLFSQDKEELDLFRKIILSSDPKEEGLRIKFDCTMEKASYILFKLRPMFYNFSNKAIAESQVFYTKQNKPLSQRSIESSKNSFINIKHEMVEAIDEAFDSFQIS